MQLVWIYTLSSVLIVSIISLVGVLTIAIRQTYLKQILLFFISFAAGAMLGDVFIHLFPELISEGEFSLATSLYILGGIILFFILEKILHWRHCHMTATSDHIHPLAYMNLIGDAIHNFTDGIVIASSFIVSVPLGIATTVAVVLHEIPQEMGDFGVLLHSGMKVSKALFFNFISALSAIIGAILTLTLNLNGETVLKYIIPFVIGGFLYIASSDLIPELHKDVKPINSIMQLFSLMLGIGIMILFLNLG